LREKRQAAGLRRLEPVRKIARLRRHEACGYNLRIGSNPLVQYFPWLGFDDTKQALNAKRRFTMSNYAFCDGHVKAMGFDQTWGPSNMHVP
jgi:prepilin-type processing-associated H-X9-DG protein